MNKKSLYTIIIFIVLASLDNAAIAILPAITRLVAVRLLGNEYLEGYVLNLVSIMTFIIAFTSFVWGYWGDKYPRKKLLLYGTVIWVVMCFLTYFSLNYVMLAIFQIFAGIGLGAIASVGFSVIVDFVSANRRGLALSLWGLSQAAGTMIGYLIAVLFAADFGWAYPFLVISIVSVGFIIAYFFTEEPKRGAKEKELQKLFEEGKLYEYRIRRQDLKDIITNRSNIWLILQGAFAQVGWGAIAILPSIFGHKLSLYGFTVDQGQEVGGLIAALFQLGGIFSILFGWLGDKLQKRTLKGRSIISAFGVFTGIPLFITMLLIPYNFDTTSFSDPISFVFGQLASNPLFLIAFICSVFAAMMMSADSPNFFALVGDVNLPEHRGTLFGLTNFTNGIGRSLGPFILSGFQILLTPIVGFELSWVYGMVFIQFFFLATGIFFLLTARAAPHNIREVKKTLESRARQEI
ncbi:MAG: MFS transporter [Candidatus Lokiarchaeota archaeon]|nr:MFS transporter [Candidatus Lokiarchaeota archaeon]